MDAKKTLGGNKPVHYYSQTAFISYPDVFFSLTKIYFEAKGMKICSQKSAGNTAFLNYFIG